jgi:hypothetical protein
MELTRAAVVGAGPAGTIADVTLQYAGVPADEIVLFDGAGDPLDIWRRETRAIRQVSMRSESEGHLFATDFPGLALIDTVRERSPMPLALSAVNRYHPSLNTVLRHAEAVSQHYGTSRRIQRAHITRIERRLEPGPHFALFDADGTQRTLARHVLLALGHGPWRWPAALQDAAGRAALQDVVFHSYQAKDYSFGSAVIVGSGMAAVGEWVNVLGAGGRVVALHRTDRLRQQSLSAPRCAFGGPWLDRYHSLADQERAATIADLARGSAPRPRAWKRILSAAAREGRIVHLVGELTGVRRGTAGVHVSIDGEGTRRDVEAEVLIAATGFQAGWEQYDLVRDLVLQHGLATHAHHLVLTDDCRIPALSVESSALAVSGPLAVWAYPAADSFACMKYAARRFTQQVVGDRAFGLRRLPAWADMVRGGWPRSRDEVRASVCATP